ncbi:hypothetical protein MP638_000698 [Amoeboaphelidium occidentale]|nr:hypothetical protein MP638_000698 [Amoeboaphelidium occidentale]
MLRINSGQQASSSSNSLLGVRETKENKNRKEIGKYGKWTVSSCKSGFGATLLRDGNLTTFWQSDGPQPHFINVQFQKKINLGTVSLYLDYKQDESYTPNKILIKAGTDHRNAHEITTVELQEPIGWQDIDLRVDDGDEGEGSEPLQAHFVQISILTNHQNGKDSHVRQVKIYSRDSDSENMETPQTMEFQHFSVMR